MTAKTPEMEAFLNNFTKKTFGRVRNNNECVSCGSDNVAKPDYFRDNVSWEEWKISKMCQRCQDKVWGNE